MTLLSVPLASLATLITKGTTPTTLGYSFVDSGIPFLRVQNIFGGQVNFAADTLFIDAVTHKAFKRSQIQAGDVLVTIAGTIGRTGVVPSHVPGLNCNQAVAIVRLTDKVDRTYLRYWLESADAKTQMIGSTVTGTISNLSLSQLGGLKVPLPPLPEQRRIAAILDQAETLRTQRRTALAQLDSLTQSIFLGMFGDPKLNEKGWGVKSIGSLALEIRGGANLSPEDFLDVGFPVLHKGAIQAGGVLNLEAKKKICTSAEFAASHRQSVVDSRYVVVTLRDLVPNGPSIGLAVDLKNAELPEYLLAQGAYGLLLNSELVVPEYFVRVSAMPSFRPVFKQMAVGSTQIHIRIPVYTAIPIPIPPLPLQQTFATRIQAIEALKATHRSALTALDALFAALQQRAFAGLL